MRITEYVGKEGVVSSAYDHSRAQKPRPGDLIRWSNGNFGRVWEVGTGYCDPDEVHVCNEPGSAFLGWIQDQPDDPRHYPYEHLKGKRGHVYVSISGGPFTMLKLSALKPTFELGPSTMWNWGDNSAGADMGVDYTLTRPDLRRRPLAMIMPSAAAIADYMMVEIEQDIAAGKVSDRVTSFSQLHNYVDANEYLLAAGRQLGFDPSCWLKLCNAATAQVDYLLKARHIPGPSPLMYGFKNLCSACGQGYDDSHLCDLDPDLDPELDEALVVTVTGVAYHRNGSAGEGFHAVSFVTFDENASARKLTAVVTPTFCGVIGPDINECYRGDYVESDLRAAIAQWETERKDSSND